MLEIKEQQNINQLDKFIIQQQMNTTLTYLLL